MQRSSEVKKSMRDAAAAFGKIVDELLSELVEQVELELSAGVYEQSVFDYLENNGVDVNEDLIESIREYMSTLAYGTSPMDMAWIAVKAAMNETINGKSVSGDAAGKMLLRHVIAQDSIVETLQKRVLAMYQSGKLK